MTNLNYLECQQGDQPRDATVRCGELAEPFPEQKDLVMGRLKTRIGKAFRCKPNAVGLPRSARYMVEGCSHDMPFFVQWYT